MRSINVLLSPKAENPAWNPPRLRSFFDRLPPCCENLPTALEFAVSSSLYDDGLIRATRCHPTARRLERRRRGSAGEVDPAGATRIASAGALLYESRRRGAHLANHRARQRGVS